MACFKILNLLTVLSLLFSATTTVTAISTDEVDAVLLLLRAQGHMLFANAISTSDMLFDILSLPTLTLLAPTDPTLFALDMTNTPPFYISTLRLHALPLRLSWSQLRFLPNGSFLPTLLPSRQLRVVRRQQINTFVVDGGSTVEVVMPGLYYGSDVAVHALGGILTFRSKIPTDNNNNNNNRTTIFIPRINNTSSPSTNNTNRTVFFPPLPRIPNILPIINHTIPPPHINRTNRPHPPFNHANRTGFSLVNHTNSSPVNRTIVVSPPVLAPSPAPAVPAPSPAPTAPAPLPWSSSGLALSPANSPAPTIPEEPKSRKMREVLASGEMCAVG